MKDCVKCEIIKTFIKSLDKEFIEIDILGQKDGDKFIKKNHILSAPVLSVDGKLYHGNDLPLNPKMIKDMLNG